MLEGILEYVGDHIALAPYILFALLLLGGFNLPVSEDALLFTSALLAAEHREYTRALFMGVFLGAYASDLICYALFGRYLRQKIFELRFFRSERRRRTLKKVESFYERYGILTLFVGRFIPFGVRNVLFMAAGLGGMGAVKFSMADFFSCLISCLLYFNLYRVLGPSVIPLVQQAHGALLLGGLVVVGFLIFFAYRRK